MFASPHQTGISYGSLGSSRSLGLSLNSLLPASCWIDDRCHTILAILEVVVS